MKRPGGPVPALLQNSEIDLFTHSPFASRPLTHSHGAPFGGALRARLVGHSLFMIGANGSVRGKKEFEPSSLAAESEPLLALT